MYSADLWERGLKPRPPFEGPWKSEHSRPETRLFSQPFFSVQRSHGRVPGHSHRLEAPTPVHPVVWQGLEVGRRNPGAVGRTAPGDPTARPIPAETRRSGGPPRRAQA